jgi:glutathione synthase/RimK-type ligase-like ATP-grasp enzyme
MKKIAYLSSKVTLPGSPIRRSDAFEHDRMMDALRPAFKAQGMSVHDVDWADEMVNWSDFDAALIGTTWDYWDHWDTFLETLSNIEAKIPLFNGAKLVRWNSHKGYLRDLEAKGARLIPTLWIDQVTPQNAADAFDTLSSETLVFKRQVGAGADGQYRLRCGDDLPDMPNPMMVQPFLPKIVEEGEISFIFVDGEFSHALIKRAAKGDYRIQSTYGGTEEAITPSTEDLSDAKAILGALDVPPLYARVDMLRGEDGGLLLMEMELIEPYLYPVEGPELGVRMAAAVLKRLG